MSFGLWKFYSMTLGVITALATIAQGIPPHSDYYRAGVVEFRPVIAGMSSADMLQDHLDSYLEFIESAAKAQVDILVFPEGTLNNPLQLSFVPDPVAKINPCTDFGMNSTDFLTKLSCAAGQHSIYVVVNLSEKEACQQDQEERPCATNGLNIYNTNVVFDRKGQVIARYRKVNLYLEAKNTTQEPEYGIFDTDFGIRFGLFTCFDINFYTPAQELVTKHKVKNFIYTSWWYSELPFLTASQLQQSWAWANDVNLLAAGSSNPAGGSTGSGIYAGHHGYLQAVMVGGSGIRELFIADVPKTDEKPELLAETYVDPSHIIHTDIKLMKDPCIENFTSILLDFESKTTISERLCQHDFCCQFDIEVNVDYLHFFLLRYHYRIGIYKGSRSYEKEARTDLQLCALYACTNKTASSCGEIMQRNDHSLLLNFKHIQIVGEFAKSKKLLIMPSSLTHHLYPLMGDDVEWTVTDQRSSYKVAYKLTETHNDLLTFGIYANYYERSGSECCSDQAHFILVYACLYIAYRFRQIFSYA